MSLHRLLARSIVAVVASLALVGGVTPVASAAGATTSAAATTMTSAERCTKEKKDVKRAKKRLARAKDADKNRAAKVKKAKKNLQKQKRQKAKWCKQAADEREAAQDADAVQAAWRALRDSAPVQALPTDVRTQMFAVVDRVVGLTDTLEAEQIPGGSAAELTRIQELLEALDPAAVQAATAAFVNKLDTATSQPDTLSSLITALTSGLPSTVLKPGSDMAELQKAMQDIIDALAAFEPSRGKTAMDMLVQAIQDATAALQTSTESGDLEQLVSSVTEMNGGEPATTEQLTALLRFLIDGGAVEDFPFELPTDLDGLGALDAVLGSVAALTGGDTSLPGRDVLVPEVTGTITDLIGGGTVDLGDLGEVVDPGGIIGGIIDDLPVPLFP